MRVCADCGHEEKDHKELRLGGRSDGRVLAVRCQVELNTCWAGRERICRCPKFVAKEVLA